MLGGAMMVCVVVQESSITVSAAAPPTIHHSRSRFPVTNPVNLETSRTLGVMPERPLIDYSFFRQKKSRLSGVPASVRSGGAHGDTR